MRRAMLGWAGLLPAAVAAQAASPEPPAWSLRIDRVEVTAQHVPLRAEMVSTRIDSAVLHESVAMTMADVLAFNAPIFIKQYGRGTLSTASFRGTSPSHTQVTWNGMKINSPTLGMTDFSLIPAYFVGEAEVLHGTSSLGEAGGGLGGAVVLRAGGAPNRGWHASYVQGAGSFSTFDEYAEAAYGGRRWWMRTQCVASSSSNDFRYRDRDMKENIYGEQHEIVGSYYPLRRNRNGAFRDVHVQQQLGVRSKGGDRWTLTGWWTGSRRNVPALSTSYDPAFDDEYLNLQREQTIRSVAVWEHLRSRLRLSARAGYASTWLAYDYERAVSEGHRVDMTHSRSRVHTLFGRAEAEWSAAERWLVKGHVTAYQHWARMHDQGDVRDTLRARVEWAAYVSVRWNPTPRLGLTAALRQELYDRRWSPPVPAFYAEWLLSRRGGVTLRASVARNHRFPTLNDRYFRPGGNRNLRAEHGVSYDAGVAFRTGRAGRYDVSGSAAWFDSRIDDWILWLPDLRRGYWSPRNIRRVHAYGVELQARFDAALSADWHAGAEGNFAWTPSINQGDPVTPADRSPGKQLVYVPRTTANAVVRLGYRTWQLQYKWCHYGERYTMSSNEQTVTGYLPPYYMSDVTLGKRFEMRRCTLTLKGTVHNLFDEEYKSVLSRPMPGIHYEFFLEIRPKFGRR